MKKKICLISIIGLALLSGCSKGYKEGVYTGTESIVMEDKIILLPLL